MRSLLQILRGPSIVGLAVALAFAGGACATATAMGGGRASATPGDAPYAALAQLGRVLVQVENDYVDPVDRAKLVDGAIKGMVSELDPHSSYMPPDEFQAFQSDTEGEFGGIGVEVELQNEELVVLSPIEGSPAARAGIRSGDVIVSVDGKDPTVEPLDKLVKHLRGAPGSHVKVGVRRRGAPDVLAFDLRREVVHVPSVSSTLLGGRIAYVHIRQFQEHTHDELLDAAAKLRVRAGGAIAAIIVDMRSNPGGLVDQAADVADEFLDGGVIYTARHRGEIVDQVNARAGGVFAREPCVVLVDQYTASASELVAGALQDSRRASVVGERTFGKGSVQAIVALPGGAGMRLTVSRYYTPSGHAIQADGVHPDVVVETKKDEGGVSYREKDLDGHLAPEPGGGIRAPPKSVVVVVAAEGDAGQPSATSTGSEADDVPADPEKGHDSVLRVGWEVLHQAILRAGPGSTRTP
jgi:carboxyl-terminal processing protease